MIIINQRVLFLLTTSPELFGDFIEGRQILSKLYTGMIFECPSFKDVQIILVCCICRSPALKTDLKKNDNFPAKPLGSGL